jgi:hypothetical protein
LRENTFMCSTVFKRGNIPTLCTWMYAYHILVFMLYQMIYTLKIFKLMNFLYE